MCECGIKDGCAQFQHCLEAKIQILEELNLTRQEKWKSDEERKKAEQKLVVAQDKIQKMEEAIKKMEETVKRVVDQKMEIELQLADIVDGHNINEQATRLKMNKIKKICSTERNQFTICHRCYYYPSRGYNLYVRIF